MFTFNLLRIYVFRNLLRIYVFKNGCSNKWEFIITMLLKNFVTVA